MSDQRRERPSRSRRIPAPTPAALVAARAVEADIRSADHEIMVAVDQSGREILRKDGTEDHVDLEPAEVRRLRHAVITHNHPPHLDVSFSLSDVRLAALAGASEVRVVTRRLIYSLRPSPAGWSLDWADRQLRTAYDQEYRSLVPFMLDRIRRGDDRETVTAETIHEIWTRVARRPGLRYGLEGEAVE